MSRNYDNWERLVAAVVKREEIWEICHAHSRNTSFSSSISSDFNSQFEQDLKSARSAVQELSPSPQIEVEWIEQYEPGVYITLGYSRDDTTEIRRVRFRPRTESGPFSDTSDHVELVMLEIPVLLGTRSPFSTNMKPTDSLVDTRANIQTVTEWVEIYEPDVYVSLREYRDGTRDVVRVRFSGIKFEARQAEAWWLINREKVCEKYGARAGLAQIFKST
ncbi:protein brevis radix-like 2 [Phtheirospermum japonicum]|uniref:Protein brevis radix-like 2 n=1 Tax=Phtheirospermum japonicum TaxID=374723 RepID=A0A830B0P8_9LAMI|nr:protein brevis radix-like 2 [Phtheirospermum japonicum]